MDQPWQLQHVHRQRLHASYAAAAIWCDVYSTTDFVNAILAICMRTHIPDVVALAVHKCKQMNSRLFWLESPEYKLQKQFALAL